MTLKNAPIGVFDSGVGGFSVARELQRLLPGEDIVYYGDSANMPYGNRSAADILTLTRRILAYMCESGVKAAAVACNTISALIEDCRADVPFKLFSVVEAGADYAATLDTRAVGVIGTPFTVRTGIYARLITARRPEMTVISAPCPNLARLIEMGETSKPDVEIELRIAVDNLLARAPITHLILGCTHYPLLGNRLQSMYPGLSLINPGQLQAIAIKNFLTGRCLLASDGRGLITMETSGDPESYVRAARRFGLKNVRVTRRPLVHD